MSPVVCLIDNPGGSLRSGDLRDSLFLGGVAAFAIAVLFPVLLRGDRVQRILAMVLLPVPVTKLLYAFLIAANMW